MCDECIVKLEAKSSQRTVQGEYTDTIISFIKINISYKQIIYLIINIILPLHLILDPTKYVVNNWKPSMPATSKP